MKQADCIDSKLLEIMVATGLSAAVKAITKMRRKIAKPISINKSKI